MLTGDEREAVRLAGHLYAHIRDKVCGDGPTRDDDLTEVRTAIHHVQHLVMSQAAARLYPGEFRLMGEIIEAMTGLADDPTLRLAVVTGAGGRAFVGGADIDALA